MHQTNTGSRAETGTAVRLLSLFLAVGIVFLVVCNGFFTYSGALLYIHESLYALLFAVAVQFAIAATLLALPYVRGLGRLVMLLVYFAAFGLSTLSAFTYVYNTSHPDGLDMQAVTTPLKARVSTLASEALSAERLHIEQRQQVLRNNERQMNEEANYGYKSGRGPGKGPEFLLKEEAFAEATAALEVEKDKFERSQHLYDEINVALTTTGDNSLRESLIVLFSQLRTTTNTAVAGKLIESITEQQLGQLQNPVERAIYALKDTNGYSIVMIASLVWAAIFDLLALFIGIIRYYLVKPDFSLAQSIYESIINFLCFIFRIKNIRHEARLRNHQHLQQIAEPVNSPEMQSFATYLLAGSQLAMLEGETDPMEPLRRLGRCMTPLAGARNTNQVGIPYQTLQKETRLNALMALLVQTGIFHNDTSGKCYVLSAAAEMTSRVMVFLRLSMKEQPDKIEGVKFMLQPENGLPPLPA